MARVTNEALAEMVGAVDDKVVKLTGEVVLVKKDQAVMSAAIVNLEKAVTEANGRQRQDEKDLIAVKTAQENCPARLAHGKKGNPNGEDESPWSLAKWGIRQYGLYGVQCAVILGLLVIIAKLVEVI